MRTSPIADVIPFPLDQLSHIPALSFLSSAPTVPTWSQLSCAAPVKAKRLKLSGVQSASSRCPWNPCHHSFPNFCLLVTQNRDEARVQAENSFASRQVPCSKPERTLREYLRTNMLCCFHHLRTKNVVSTQCAARGLRRKATQLSPKPSITAENQPCTPQKHRWRIMNTAPFPPEVHEPKQGTSCALPSAQPKTLSRMQAGSQCTTDSRGCQIPGWATSKLSWCQRSRKSCHSDFSRETGVAVHSFVSTRN